MVLKVALSFPTESGREMATRMKAAFERDFPPHLTVAGPYTFVFMHEGFRSFVFFEFDDNRAGEAIDFVRAFPGQFVGVPGFTYLVEFASTAEEKARILGL